MPSFRSAETQAEHAVRQMVAFGTSRRETRGDARISSVGTARSYQQALKQFCRYQKDQRSDLKSATPDQARDWLAQRAGQVGQKMLDQDRQALQAFFSHRGSDARFNRADHPSQRVTRGLAEQQRYYGREQIAAIAERQGERNALATRVAAEAGLRAAELHTIARMDEQPPSAGRPWREDRFTGHEGTASYTVKGKGGLFREIRISAATARELEAHRRDAPVQVTDRGVHHTSYYDIGGGNAWSKSFGDASKNACGFSKGAHGLRHTYAHERQDTLQGLGYSYNAARAVVAQEVGHFADATTETYLR